MTMGQRLTREDVLNAKDIVQEEVEVKQWGGSVLVQALSGKKRADILSTCMSEKGKMDTVILYPALIVAGCVDPTFTRADADALNEKNSGALETLAAAVMRLSGITKDDVETIKKN